MQFAFNGLTAKEAAFIVSALAEFPIKQCGELHRKLTEQYQNQVAAQAVPPPAPAAPPPGE